MPIATPQGTLDFKSVDKVTFVGASSNTVIDTTTGSLGVGVGVGGPTSNLHVMGNTRLEGDINMLHTANTASIKLNSNVVTEFPRSKKLIRYPRVALTAASGESSGYQGYYVTESSNAAFDTDRTSWKAFNMTFSNADSDDTWTIDEGTNYNGTGNTYNPSADSPVKNLGTGAVDGEWIKLQLPHKIRLEYMKIWLKDNDGTRIPEDWILYGSNDNTNWTELFSKTGQAAINENQYSVNATSVYDYFAVVVTKISGQNNYFRIVELEYFGVPEYDPEAHGTDVVVKSIPNVPNTDWLEVYYDAKDLADGAVTSVDDLTPSGTNDGTATNVTVSDGAFVFDGNGDYIETTLGSHISGDWTNTVSFWIAWNAIPTSGAQTPFMIGQPNTSTNGIGVDFNANSSMIYFTTSGDTVTIDNVFDLITPGKWIHFTFIHTPSEKYVYWDGKQVGIWASGGAATLPTSPTLSIGRRGSSPTNYTNAKIANFRLFNRALSQDEIYQLYAYQKEYFGHGDLGMTLKAGRLGIGTSEPRAMLDVRGSLNFGIPNVHSDSLSGSGSISAATEEAGYAPLGNDMYVVWGNYALAHTGSGQYNWTWYFPNNFTMTVLSAVGTLRDCGYGYSYDRSGLGINGYYTNRISGHTKNDTIGAFTQHIHFVVIGKKV